MFLSHATNCLALFANGYDYRNEIDWNLVRIVCINCKNFLYFDYLTKINIDSSLKPYTNHSCIVMFNEETLISALWPVRMSQRDILFENFVYAAYSKCVYFQIYSPIVSTAISFGLVSSHDSQNDLFKVFCLWVSSASGFVSCLITNQNWIQQTKCRMCLKWAF